MIYEAYKNMVKIIDSMDVDNRTLIMPYDFKGIDLHEILKLLLVDMSLRNFVALFPCYVHYFDHKDYRSIAEFLFQLIRDNKHDYLVCDTIRFFISEALVDEWLIKWQDIPEDVRCIIDNIDYEEVTAEEIEYWGVEFADNVE